VSDAHKERMAENRRTLSLLRHLRRGGHGARIARCVAHKERFRRPTERPIL
jgi:hypothetical protein